MNESRLMQSMLLDFYGELLTDKQRECFDLHYNEDLSLSEIAQQLGISRQGVWDNIKRAEDSLRDIEKKTGLIRRFGETERGLSELKKKLEALKAISDGRAEALITEAEADIEALMSGGTNGI